MRKGIVLILLPLLVVSCATEEQKMQKIIKNYLYTTLDDFKSYEPISFSPADSCFSDWTMDPLLPKIEADYERMTRIADSLTVVRDRKAARGYSLSDLTDDINLYFIATYYTTVAYPSKKDSIKNHYVSEFLGYGINHVFRSNNRLGATERHNLQFIIDPTKTDVIIVRDIDAGNEITNHHKILNKDEKEALEVQAMLDKYPNIKERSQAFLEENKNKEGVIVTSSGLQYRVISEGKGSHPKMDTKVKCNYVLKSIDGEILDSNGDEPAQLAPKYVIKGMQEALLMMRPGAKYEIFVPYDLGFGEKGNSIVPPYAATIYEVELLSID